MSPGLVIFVLASYFIVLLVISLVTSKGATLETFFTANRKSPWYLVAFGMIGTSLSGITFVSVPATVGQVGFGYFQVVLGYLVGYWVIITVLMPLFYRLELTSIYTYLAHRFGTAAHKTGALFFLISRAIGSSLRLFLAATVLHIFLFRAWDFPFYATVTITIAFIWVYTAKGGIKTVVWTDTFQTLFLLLALIFSIVIIADRLNFSLGELVQTVGRSDYSRLFFLDDVNSKLFFPKQFLGGAFIAISMTGLDQDMMQKNLTCKNLKEAQKNMFWFSLALVPVNALFLTLGALLYIYSHQYGVPIPASQDELFPMLALNELGLMAGIFFLLGITASAYSSSDSALTALTTSFCVDFLDFKNKGEVVKQRQKNRVHVGFSVLFLLIILIFKEVNESALIDAVLTIAGYTYGPLLGLFAFGLFTRKQVSGWWIPIVCVLSPVVSYLLTLATAEILNGYQIGLEILPINGLLTFCGFFFGRKIDEMPK